MAFEPKHKNLANGKKLPEMTSISLPKEEPEKPAKIAKPKADKKAKKTEKKGNKTTKEVTFPVEGFVNGYGFLKLKKAVLDKLGWNCKLGKKERTPVTLDVQDGVLIVKKRA